MRKLFKESNVENPTLEVFAHSSHIHKRQSIYETINPCDGFHWIYVLLTNSPPSTTSTVVPIEPTLSVIKPPASTHASSSSWGFKRYTCCEVVFHPLHSINIGSFPVRCTERVFCDFIFDESVKLVYTN